MQFEIEIKNYRCFSDEKPAKFIVQPGFTAFVGVNNSGKSALLRFFYELRHILINYANVAVSVNTNVEQHIMLKDRQQIFCNKNDRALTLSITSHERGMGGPSLHPFTCYYVLEKNYVWRLERIQTPSLEITNIEDDFKYNGDYLNYRGNTGIYIQPVWTILKNLANSLYIGPFRNAINVGSNDDYYDIQTGEAFIKKWRSMKTGDNVSQNEAALRLTKDIKRIFDFEQFEINPSDDSKTLQLFINEKSYILNEVGAGLTQFILLLANASIINPAYIFIDEPELNLHPSLQLDFLTTLGSYAREGVFFATHNIGLARSSADRIYGLRLKKSISEIQPLELMPRLTEFVGELSYSGYRDLGYNSVLLVEGVTDIKTVQQFLRMIKKDHNILLIPLGGGSLINADREQELEELKRIPAANFYALIDSERASETASLSPDRQGFCEVCKRLGISCHSLERRAMENYLTEPAIQAENDTTYHALGAYEKLNAVDPSWGKNANWRIARRMQFSDIEATDLEEFLRSIQ